MININNIPKAYSEVYELINALGDEYKNKIPERIYLKIKNNRDKEYVPHYNAEQTNAEFSKEALALIAALNLQYWCEDEAEKQRLKQCYIENGKREEEKYSYENLFKKEVKEEVLEQEVQNENALVEYRQPNIIVKLIQKIKNWLTKTDRF